MANERRDELARILQSMEAERNALDVQIDALRKAIEVMDGRPNLDDLRTIAIGGGKQRARKSTYVDKIIYFLIKNNNEPQTVHEMAVGLNEQKQSLNNVIYNTHKDLFVRSTVPGHEQRYAWSLKPEVFERVASSSPQELQPCPA